MVVKSLFLFRYKAKFYDKIAPSTGLNQFSFIIEDFAQRRFL